MMAEQVEAGRSAFARQAWAQAFAAFAATPRDELQPGDIERMAVAAYMLGQDDESAAAWEAAHRHYAEANAPAEAARCSFWLALCMLLRGQPARAGGWLSRTERIIGAEPDCTAAGYLMIPGLLNALHNGDFSGARAMAVRATEIGSRFGDPDLHAFGTLGHGQALIAMGETTAGFALLDEVMLSVTAGEVGPITSGIVYCAVILECMSLFDLSRAYEWTRALSAWCDAQPDLVPYRGQCLVHRSQLQQLAGEWQDAIMTIESACRRLADPPHPALGFAYYQEAELHRLLGAFDDAEAEYRIANRSGHHAMPGLALLELARGNANGAAATMRRALRETGNPLERPLLLAAAVDIFCASSDVADARIAADDLAGIASGSGSEVLDAMAAHAIGAVLLAEGDATDALAHLRAAAAAWQRLRMPYEAARTGALIAVSCAAVGDRAAAALELDNAHDIFSELGARPDLARVQSLVARLGLRAGRRRATDGPPALSAREREVLAHVAAGQTSREIATELVISEHTVRRHLENIFAKLGVTSRAAAIARAYEAKIL